MIEHGLPVCLYCSKVCYGSGYQRMDLGYCRIIHYHQRCHAEEQDRAVYPQKKGTYVPYTNPDELNWKKEKDDLLEKHKIEVDSYKKMVDEKMDSMDEMKEKIGKLEVKLENAQTNRAIMVPLPEVARMMEQTEKKMIAGLEKMMEEKLGNLREQFVAAFAPSLAEK